MKGIKYEGFPVNSQELLKSCGWKFKDKAPMATLGFLKLWYGRDERYPDLSPKYWLDYGALMPFSEYDLAPIILQAGKELAYEEIREELRKESEERIWNLLPR